MQSVRLRQIGTWALILSRLDSVASIDPKTHKTQEPSQSHISGTSMLLLASSGNLMHLVSPERTP